MSNVQDIDEQRFLAEKLKVLQGHINHLEIQCAKYGDTNVPFYIVNEIEEYRVKIAATEEQLRAISIPEQPPPRKTHNLPHRVDSFVGRKKELEELIKQLRGRAYIICIEGIGGIGKTSLAIEVAYRILEREDSKKNARASQSVRRAPPQYNLDRDEFKGIIWVSAKDRKPMLNDVLNTIARVLGQEKLNQLPEDKKIEAIKRLLEEQRYLLVIDNFETIDDDSIYQFVGDIPEPSKTLITSRKQLPAPAPVLPFPLRGMPLDDALKLIRNEAERLKLDAIAKEPDEVLSRLYEGTGGMPLAIKWALGQTREGGQTLKRVLSSLYKATGGVFETIFGRSFGLLTFNARQVLRSLLVFSAPANREAIGAVSGIEDFELDEALKQLVKLLLVDVNVISSSEILYDLHTLTRSYAAKELQEQEGLESSNARLRLARYYLSYVKDHTTAATSDNYQALEREHANIFASLYWCYKQGLTVEVEQRTLWSMFIAFVDGLVDYLWARGYWTERVDICQKAYEVCKELNDWEEAGRQAYAIGWVYWEQNNIDQARRWAEACQQAMQLANQQNGLALALAKHLLGLVSMQRADYSSANTYFMEALAITPSDLNGVGGPGSIMSELGHVHRLQGKLTEAKAWYEKCMAENERAGFQEGSAISKGYLAQTLFLMGQSEQAEALYHEALGLAIKVGRATTIARIHRGLAELLVQKGLLAEAATHVREAIPIFQRLNKSEDLRAVQALLTQLSEQAH